MTILDKCEELAAENAALVAEGLADFKKKARQSIRASDKVLGQSGFQFTERVQVKRKWRK